MKFLKAFAVDDSGASLVVLLLGDPHLLEGGEGSQDGASDPDGVLPLGRSDDLDLHGGRSQGGDLLLHTIGDTGVHGGATREDGVGIEILRGEGMETMIQWRYRALERTKYLGSRE